MLARIKRPKLTPSQMKAVINLKIGDIVNVIKTDTASHVYFQDEKNNKFEAVVGINGKIFSVTGV